MALRYEGRELSVAGLYARACAFANTLRGTGIARDDVVAVHPPNCPQYAVAYYGILLAGATSPRPTRCSHRPTSARSCRRLAAHR